MDEKVRVQIMAIRDSGVTNMMDATRVQREAFEQGFHELVLFLEEHRGDYVHFILFGDENRS